MGFFIEKTDGDGYRESKVKVKWGRVTGVSIASVFALTTALSSFYINEERQTSLEVLFGRVTDKETTPGWKWKNPLSSRYAYSLARQKTDVTEATNLRTGDDLRLSGKYHIEYEVDEKADVNKLYFDLQDQGGDLDNVVQVRAKDAAVRAIEALTIENLMPEEDATKNQEAASFTEQITGGINARLQDQLTKEGWPVKIIGVYSDGFHFSQESETRIEEIVSIRAEKVKLGLREENATKAEEVFRKEAQADAAYLEKLRAAGLPEKDLGTALCLKMNRDAGRVNEPFAAGCGGTNDNKTGVVVPAPLKKAAAAPAPAPQS
ncbi:MAG: SPFH domain-containing protein [Micavibrio sp.]